MKKIRFCLTRGDEKIKDEEIFSKISDEKIVFFVDKIKLSVKFDKDLTFIRETSEDVLTIKNDYAHFKFKHNNLGTVIPVDKTHLKKLDNEILVEYKFTDDEFVKINIRFID